MMNPEELLEEELLDILKNNGALNVVQLLVLKDGETSANPSDKVIIVTGTSVKHNETLAEKSLKYLKDAGVTTKSDGLGSSQWIAIDAGHIMLHIFLAEVREYYKIEKLWDSNKTKNEDCN